MMRDSLAGWLRRLANRISTPQTARAGAQAGFQDIIQFHTLALDIADVQRHIQSRAALRYSGRP